MGWLDFEDKATDDADWARSVGIFDDAGAAYDATGLEVRLNVSHGGSSVLRAGTEADYGSVVITRPTVSSIAWRFSKEQMAALVVGTTYSVGAVLVDGDGNTEQFIVGELAIVDGNME